MSQTTGKNISFKRHQYLNKFIGWSPYHFQPFGYIISGLLTIVLSINNLLLKQRECRRTILNRGSCQEHWGKKARGLKETLNFFHVGSLIWFQGRRHKETSRQLALRSKITSISEKNLICHEKMESEEWGFYLSRLAFYDIRLKNFIWFWLCRSWRRMLSRPVRINRLSWGPYTRTLAIDQYKVHGLES